MYLTIDWVAVNLSSLIRKAQTAAAHGAQFPLQHSAKLARLAATGLPHAGPSLECRRVLGHRKETITV
jgi:hypothetical protein